MNRKSLLILIYSLLLLFAGLYLDRAIIFSTPTDILKNIGWNNYTSLQAGLSFDYPTGWIVTDVVTNGSSETSEYNSLWICPSEANLITTVKEGLNNCIFFYMKNAILHPEAGPFDDSLLFSDFNQYINAQGDAYDGFRILEQESKGDDDGDVNLLGLYRSRGDFVGVSQVLCAQNKTAECFLVFKHLLDSINFLN